MSFSYKWFGEKNIYHENISVQSEKEMLIKLRDLLSEADIVVGHNSNKFDNKMVNTSFIKYNLDPPAPYKKVDTFQMAKAIGKFSSNKLNDLGEMLGIGTKTQETYASLWYDALINNDKTAWKKMKKYNNQDVALTEKLYERLRPYSTNHPNILVIDGIKEGCPRCGSHKVQRRGIRTTNVGVYQRYRCMSCGAWPSARIAEKEAVKPEFVSYS